MGEVAYRSKVSIERERGPLRWARLPAEPDPIAFGVHSEVAEHYGVTPDASPPHATTLDYLVAAAAGWLAGTFGGALEARGIPAGGGRLRADAEGEVELEGSVLVLKRIHVRYLLTVDAAVDLAVVERVHAFHAGQCPVARSIRDAIMITTELATELR
jgi:uncharacterized OsmC-like protein